MRAHVTSVDGAPAGFAHETLASDGGHRHEAPGLGELDPAGAGASRRSAARTAPSTRISVLVAHNLFRVLQRFGVSRVALCTAAGVDATTLADLEGFMTRDDGHRLALAALQLTQNPALGLAWAKHINDSDLGYVSYATAQCSTMRELLTLYGQFSRLVSDATEVTLHEGSEHATLRCHASEHATEELRPFVGAICLGTLFHRLRNIVPEARLTRLTFAHPRPAFADEYMGVFGLRPVFDAASTAMEFPIRLLDEQAHDRDGAVLANLTALAQQRVVRLTNRAPYGQRVRDLLMAGPHDARADIASVARALGLSERSLRRRLALEGSNFLEIVREARGAIAKSRLVRTRMSLQEIAYELGFASESAFHRAFRSWTGQSPGAFRRAHQG